MKIKLALLSITLLLSACFGGAEPVPQDQFYRLSDIRYTGKPLPAIATVLAVSAPDSDVLHRERAMLYSHSDEPLKLQRYHYHHWVNIPARMVQDHLIDYLRTTGLADTVLRYGEQTKIDAQIGGQLRRFERVIGRTETHVVVELELSYRARTGKQASILKVYKQEIGVSSDSLHASADAFSRALKKIYQEFVTDLIAAHRS